MIYTLNSDIYKEHGVKQCSKDFMLTTLRQKEVVGLDIETSRKYSKKYPENIYKPGLDPFMSRVVLLQIGDKEHSFVIDTRKEDPVFLQEILSSRKILKVGQFLKFEAKHLRHSFGLVLENVWDVMLADINLWNGIYNSFSLEDLAERYLGIKPDKTNLFTKKKKKKQEDDDVESLLYQGMLDKSTRLGFLNIGDKDFSYNQVAYAADDITMPLAIYDIQRHGRRVKGEIYNPTLLHQIENETTLVYADMELTGIDFDKSKWLQLYQDNLKQYQDRKQILETYIANNFTQFVSRNLFGEPEINIDWASPQQVVEFFKAQDLCPKERSKQTGLVDYTVAAKAMTKLLPANLKEAYEKGIDHDIVDDKTLILAYLNLKSSEQLIQTFGEDWLKYVHPITGRVHSNYFQIVNTGRSSSRNPNLQNIPSDEAFRNCFRVLDDNYNILAADYAGQELRVTAHKCQDVTMLDFFNNGNDTFGDDFHSYIATKMFRLIWHDDSVVITGKTHPKERQAAKSLNFKIIYGGSAYTLKYDFDVEEDEAQEFIDKYYEALPGLKAYFDVVEQQVLDQGYIVIDPITDRRYFYRDFSHYNDLKSRIYAILPSGYNEYTEEEQRLYYYQKCKEYPWLKEVWSEADRLEGKLKRDARNYPIQGTAAIMTKIAGCYIRRWYNKNGLYGKVGIPNIVHDEILGKAEQQYSQEFAKVIEQAMTEAGTKICGSVHIVAQCQIGDHWKH